MKLSNIIEDFINDMLRQAEAGEIEVRRKELADRFSCVPSQINYVISTRFSPEKGYLVESRRGGGGYIRISRIAYDSSGAKLMHVINSIGDSIGAGSAEAIVKNCFDYGLITEREEKIITNAMTEKALPLKQPDQDRIRAKILKNMLVSIA